MLLVELRPEHAEDCVASAEAAVAGDAEIHEEPETLGLAEHGVHTRAIGPSELNAS
jgi:hypothetical protein